MRPQDLRIADYTYTLPEDRIAQHPLADRSASRLLVFQDGGIADHHFSELPGQLPPGALLVVNDTRVVKARLRFKRESGAVIECMVIEPGGRTPVKRALQQQHSAEWWVMAGNAQRWKKGEVIISMDDPTLRAQRLADRDMDRLVRFTWDDERTFAHVLAGTGALPLPPYMRRKATKEDDTRYNTVFARTDGSVAAPTASLHFTDEVLNELQAKGVQQARVTLHVGAGTFLPVKSDRMEGHAMHSEEWHMSRATLIALLDAARAGRPVVPVGTTALRTLESACWCGDALARGGTAEDLSLSQWQPYDGEPLPTDQALEALLAWMDREAADEVHGRTSLLIAPGYRFRAAQGLVTNFHQPNSTLLLLVAAFIGEDWRRVYAHALANGYRFLSYGDSSLLWRNWS